MNVNDPGATGSVGIEPSQWIEGMLKETGFADAFNAGVGLHTVLLAFRERLAAGAARLNAELQQLRLGIAQRDESAPASSEPAPFVQDVAAALPTELADDADRLIAAAFRLLRRGQCCRQLAARLDAVMPQDLQGTWDSAGVRPSRDLRLGARRVCGPARWHRGRQPHPLASAR